MSVIRHKIVQYVTDRPGQVVYKDDIMNTGDFTAAQVTGVMLSIQRDSPIGPEIQTIVAGNAWRYVPKQPASNDRVKNTNLAQTLVGLIRQYFAAHPDEVVTTQQLIDFTGRTEAQVKVGVNNARNNHPTFRKSLETIVAGSLWRYTPPPGESTPRPRPQPVKSVASTEPTPVPTSPLPVASPVVMSSPTSTDDGSARLFEEVGAIGDNQIIIRDGDGVLYRATPLA